MQSSCPAVVVTSIHPPSRAMQALAEGCLERGWLFLVAGDSTTPRDFRLDGATLLDLESQRRISQFGRLCPERTYARKNVAYLAAARAGVPWMVETDDDNIPRPAFWGPRERTVRGRVADSAGWVNAYRAFADCFIYPRGFPPDLALGQWAASAPDAPGGTAVCPIQQGLADGDPDVDAIYRMLHPLPFTFRDGPPVILGPGCWCPFNSQNTVFFPEAFPLLYLPVTCSFRMTDIWRGFVAQRVLWSAGWRLSFHAATVEQERNPHDLLRDFEEEIPGTLGNKRLVALLEQLDLPEGPSGLAGKVRLCYRALIDAGFLDPLEGDMLDAWLDDLRG